jgi:uncharacterized protein
LIQINDRAKGFVVCWHIMRFLPPAALPATFMTVAVSASAAGFCFDCTTSETELARIICASPELSNLDPEFVQAYYALRQQIGEAGWPELRHEAQDFQENVTQLM